MYEHITFDSLMGRMLERVPDMIDKREGSIIYDALSSAAVELLLLYTQLDRARADSFIGTAEREYLVKQAAERGISPTPATHAIVSVSVYPGNIDITGQKFSSGDVFYTATEVLSQGDDITTWLMQCSSAGVIGNDVASKYFVPVEYISGLEKAVFDTVMTYGVDEEDTEAFRTRYLQFLRTPPFGGNVIDYKNKVAAIDGVELSRIIPNDGRVLGQVGVYVTDKRFPSSASEKTISALKDALDPLSDEGSGVGVAPIGHIVLVKSASTVKLDVSLKVTASAEVDTQRVDEKIRKAIEQYFLTKRKEWDSDVYNKYLEMKASGIVKVVLDVEGIEDVSLVTFSDGARTSSNYILDSLTDLPVLGEVNINYE